MAAQETKTVFEKLHKYIGKNIRHLVERSDEDYVLRLHKNRIYYVRESLMRRATNVSTRHSKALAAHNDSSTLILQPYHTHCLVTFCSLAAGVKG